MRLQPTYSGIPLGAIAISLGTLPLGACVGVPGSEPSMPDVSAVEVEVGEDEPGPDVDDAPECPSPEFPDADLLRSCGADTLRGSLRPSLRRLSKAELVRTLQDVFEPRRFSDLDKLQPYKDLRYRAVEDQDPLQVAVNGYPEDFSEHPGETFQDTYTADQIRHWARVVHEVSLDVVEGGWEDRFDPEGCLDVDVPDAVCWEGVVRALGRKAFRRPLDEAEVDRLVATALDGDDRAASLYGLYATVLSSPHFLYLVSRGEPVEGEERVRLTDHEVAAILAYSLTGGMPDAELAAAADAGELDLERARLHGHRLVRSERAREHLMVFFDDWLDLEHTEEPNRRWGNAVAIPTNIEGLYHSDFLDDPLRDEIRDYIRYMVWETEGSFEGLMTEPVGFPTSARTAAVFRSEFDPEGGPSWTPDHPGLLTRPGLLASAGSTPNPIRRAVRLKTKVLCQEIESPDFTIVAQRQDGVEELLPWEIPNHEATTHLTGVQPCVTCHASINPFGFALEGYNPVGQFDAEQRVFLRMHELNRNGFDRDAFPEPPDGVKSVEVARFPLPGPQELVLDEEPVSVATADDLVQAIAESGRARRCLAVRAFRHVEERCETEEDACAIAEAADALATGSVLDAFVNLVVNEDLYWRRL